jgi:hypothetical protein
MTAAQPVLQVVYQRQGGRVGQLGAALQEAMRVMDNATAFAANRNHLIWLQIEELERVGIGISLGTHENIIGTDSPLCLWPRWPQAPWSLNVLDK